MPTGTLNPHQLSLSAIPTKINDEIFILYYIICLDKVTSFHTYMRTLYFSINLLLWQTINIKYFPQHELRNKWITSIASGKETI